MSQGLGFCLFLGWDAQRGADYTLLDTGVVFNFL
jgi:hypothetical protein